MVVYRHAAFASLSPGEVRLAGTNIQPKFANFPAKSLDILKCN